MKAGVLFSGGKDSSLAAILLSRDYEIELNTFVFDRSSTLTGVGAAAETLGFPWKIRVFKEGILEEVVNIVVKCGYPNTAITELHRHAVQTLCGEYTVISDGTRLNDRVPMLSRNDVQRFFDTYGCSYIRPLLGFGKAEIERLSGRYLTFRCGETGIIDNGDYECGIRSAMRSKGLDLSRYFPEHHEQSLVVERLH
jgi:predicted subunit of tRNA(5-methylaminomethyl-2-thiouridylate) methyltransferase